MAATTRITLMGFFDMLKLKMMNHQRKHMVFLLAVISLLGFTIVLTGQANDHGLKYQLPTGLIIGSRKCGTGTLKVFLSINPHILVPPTEYSFFDHRMKYLFGKRYYMSLMPPAGDDDIIVDQVPRYFSKTYTYGRIYNMNPDVKLFLVLRDPTNRTVSDYVHLQAEGRLSRKLSFEDVVLTESGEINEGASIIWESRYYELLIELLRWFPRDQIMFVNGEEFARNPYPILKDAEKFLGAPDLIRQSDFIYDKRKGFYCMKTEGATDCMSKTKGRHHPSIDPALLEQLRTYYRPHNQKLKQLLGEDWAWLSK